RREQPSIATAVEEILRYDAPIQLRLRFAEDTLEIDGQPIKQGRAVLLMLGSANHDDCVFSEADALNLYRSPNPHLSFGGGAHYCLGARLARLEAEVVLDQAFRRFAEFEAAGPPVRDTGGVFRGFKSIPVRLKAA